MKKIILAAIVALCVAGCCRTKQSGITLLDKAAFDTVWKEKPISLYTLTNKNGVTVQLTNYGARIVSLWVPDRDGTFRDVVWGLGSIKDYLNATDVYAGPIVGRYGNRIDKGRFELDGTQYNLTINNGENHLHGGSDGWWNQVWEANEDKTPGSDQSVSMVYHSPDGEEGYPGTVDIRVTYTLSADNQLIIRYSAVTDAPTVINPTSHAYFNLHGSAEYSTNSHILTINADGFLPTDEGLIPTGEIAPVEGTPLDFRTPTTIGDRISDDFEALEFAGGYDQNWVLNKTSPKEVSLAAEVYEPSTGIDMKVYTDQLGIQFYSGNFMDGVDRDKHGIPHDYRTGIALETQNFPDAPNHHNFPSSVLRPGEVYTQKTIYFFSVKE